MVRNPEPRKRQGARADFVKKYQRINVALSRARRILVVVGAKDFLSQMTIDLEDDLGNVSPDRRAFPVYAKIIETCAVHGAELKASDVIEEGK
jgi:superfamily I DNA and/or RNA helicase